MSGTDRKLDKRPLPRGLITRSGIPLNPNQRLPSLKTSLNSNTIISNSNFSNNCPVTRSGAFKRIFKPAILETKRPVEISFKNKLTSSLNFKSKKESFKKNKNKRQTEYIQVKSLVFNGTTGISQSKPQNTTITKVSNISNCQSSSKQSEPSNDLKLIDKKKPISQEEKLLLCDDFIERPKDYCDNEMSRFPKGWFMAESLENEQTSFESGDNLNFWFNKGHQDKFILMQMPEFLGARNEGKIGKLRVYKSGKTELVDNSNKLIFNIVKPNDKDFSKTSTSLDSKPNREVVSFSEKELMCLGSMDTENTYLLVPRVLDFLNLK